MRDTIRLSAGETLTVLDSSPAALVVDAAYAPRGSAPPAHFHPAQTERFTCLEGALDVVLAGERRTLARGDELTIPPGTTHRMWNPHDAPARVRWETSPALRTEAWFRSVGALQEEAHARGSDHPDVLALLALADAHGDVFRLALGPQPAMRALTFVAARLAPLLGRR